MKLSTFVAAAALIGGSLQIPNSAEAYPASRLDATNRYQLEAIEGKTNTLIRGFNYNQNLPNAFRKGTQLNEASSRCPPGKKYYERRSGVAFFGIKLGKGKKTWSGCLTDGEAAAAGAGTTTHTPAYVPPVKTYQSCYGSTYGNSFSMNCY